MTPSETTCPTCFGRGFDYIPNKNGVIHRVDCTPCNGTGRVAKTVWAGDEEYSKAWSEVNHQLQPVGPDIPLDTPNPPADERLERAMERTAELYRLSDDCPPELAKAIGMLRQLINESRDLTSSQLIWDILKTPINTLMANHTVSVLERLLEREEAGTLNERYGHWIACAAVQEAITRTRKELNHE